MRTLAGARLISATGSQVEIGLDSGFRLTLLFLDRPLARMLITRPGGLRMPRTWSLSPELSGNDPIDGRDRLDHTGFPGSPIRSVGENASGLVIETALTKVEIERTPLSLSWSFRSSEADPFDLMLLDRKTQAYCFDRSAARFAHYLGRDREAHYYGFGEKSGNANKHGRRLRMRTTDALGYDARTTDPLYKHIPFYITVRPDLGGAAIGLFYDNLARGAFDLGQEIHAYHGLYRSFEAEDGDLDLYIIFGPALADVVARYTALTGRTAFAPRWSLSYSGSSMNYADAADAGGQFERFLSLLKTHGIVCQSFHLSSGYTKRDGKRYVFAWDRERYRDPAAFVRRFEDAGIRLIANIKPAMLVDHPRFAEVERFRGFVRDGEDEDRPCISQFWGGEAAYLDFTNPRTSVWWEEQVHRQLLDYGVVATWNDNNEFAIEDGSARVDLNGRGGAMGCLRPVQTNLMLRASTLAQSRHAPAKRPFVVTRSGGPGMQRYAQTWTGDNRTDWETLRYNLRMGHGLSLSGIFNFGHDIGGFAGAKPGPELFMRWVEQGIYWPRFSIHSWNDDGTSNEPWMYPEILPQIRAALDWRERLVPLLYTLAWRAHAHHEPILRPVFYDFPGEAGSYVEQDAFMLGRDLLVAPVVDPGVQCRDVWLPNWEGGWYDIRTGEHFCSGTHVAVSAPLGSTPAFIRAGAMLPLGPCPSFGGGPLALRMFPVPLGRYRFELYDDDGESIVDRNDPPCLVGIGAEWRGSDVILEIRRTGRRLPRWLSMDFESPAGTPLATTITGAAGMTSIRLDASFGQPNSA